MAKTSPRRTTVELSSVHGTLPDLGLSPAPAAGFDPAVTIPLSLISSRWRCWWELFRWRAHEPLRTGELAGVGATWVFMAPRCWCSCSSSLRPPIGIALDVWRPQLSYRTPAKRTWRETFPPAWWRLFHAASLSGGNSELHPACRPCAGRKHLRCVAVSLPNLGGPTY